MSHFYLIKDLVELVH